MTLGNINFPVLVLVDTSNCLLEKISHLVPLTDEYIQKRIKDSTPEQYKINSVIGCLLRKYLLKKYFNIDYKQQKIIFNENNKPYLKNSKAYFNISHSNTFVVCAINSSPIGVDIEKIMSYSTDICNYCFSEKEHNSIKLSNNPDIEFTKLWCTKESQIKLKGKKLSNIKDVFNNIKTYTIKYKNYIISYSIEE